MTYAELAATAALATLRSNALALIPARHLGGDVAYVETTETLCQDADARTLSPEALAARVTESLDNSAANWAAEQEMEAKS